MGEKKYNLNGETYVQRPLVLGQIRQLMGVLEGLAIPADVDGLGMVAILGDRLGLALAVVLTKDGTSPADKDLEAGAKEIEFSIEPEIAIEVVEDFFDCNPIISILEKVTGVVGRLTQKVAGMTGSSKPASSSLEETSPGGTESSGDTLQASASPT